MKIIFAQGNPGQQYQMTRHNIGFMAVDEIARTEQVDFSKKPKFHADIAEFSAGGEKILLVKPTTFYNETGQSARLLIDFYKLKPEEDFLVIHDDLALPLGTIRTREKGSDAGNNGVKSLNAHIGQAHKRIRIGIYSELRDRVHDADFVLGSFAPPEREKLPAIIQQARVFVDAFIDESFPSTKVTV